MGYHSFRRRPDTAAVTAVCEMYATLRAEEQRHTSSPEVLEASSALLQRLPAGRGQSYDEFVWGLTS